VLIDSLLVILIFIALWYFVPYVVKKLQIDRLRRVCKEKSAIVLTYDDGPGLTVSVKLLELLRSHASVATFFILGRKIAPSKELVARIIQDGHEIGSHSYSHLHAWKRDPVSVFLDTQRGLRVARSVAECRLFRAPYGKLTLGSMIQVWLQGCRQSWWTIDSTDTWDNPRDIAEILERVRVQGGGVVLMHDLDRPGMPEHEKFVLDLTQALLELAKNEGFRVCKLGEVIS
jgi:peptidoglycan/xylan/chitin deacetylase (PgdA/CDA1 family)